ncbi:MAG TPA: hypothetical protein VKB65_07170 [Myxococcota bacterium]|nr:hypothetical protein [Myxococcota bacterium]
MIRALALPMGLAFTLSLSACGGDTCESVQEEIQSIGREIQKDPTKAMDSDTGEKLEKLRDKLQEMDCLG